FGVEPGRYLAISRRPESAQPRRSRALRRLPAYHPTRQFAPAVPNAGFAPHCRRSDARGLTSQIDPYEPFVVASADDWGDQEAVTRRCTHKLTKAPLSTQTRR